MKHILLVIGLAVGCDSDPSRRNFEFMPEMIDSVPYDTFAPNPLLPGGKTLQPPPAGTIARRAAAPFLYGPGNVEAERAGRELRNPLQPTAENLARGEQLFRSFCFPCHGRGGEGDGPVIPRFPTPPSYLAPHARALPDGRLFHIISRGQGLMPAHALQVEPEDRWRLVLHIRALQAPAKGAAK